jgi:prefoldin subunit 5
MEEEELARVQQEIERLQQEQETIMRRQATAQRTEAQITHINKERARLCNTHFLQ